MSKSTYEVPVADLPFIDSLKDVGYTDRKRYGLILPSGHRNDYRIERMRGRGGSSKDTTWDRTSHTHTCCGSRCCWRHKVTCPLLSFGDEA